MHHNEIKLQANGVPRLNPGSTVPPNANKHLEISPLQKSPDDELKRQELAENIMDWFSIGRSGTHEIPGPRHHQSNSEAETDESDSSSSETRSRRRNSIHSNGSFDSDDKEHNSGDDGEENALRRMDYKSRRKHIQRIRIQFNVSGK